ncbi:MAG: putative transposase, partial [Gemmatimonadetes bacterium]|nr:putative transposase [Gemmatimonadota bacterium]
ETILCAVVQAYWKTFLADLEANAESSLPAFVVAEVEAPHIVPRWRLSFPGGSTPVFHPTPAPRDEDIARVAAAVCRRVERKHWSRAHGALLASPPIATERLARLTDGRLALQLNRPWRDGTTAFVLTPHALIERLVALVPRPRAHLTRYFGVFAPACPLCRRA